MVAASGTRTATASCSHSMSKTRKKPSSSAAIFRHRSTHPRSIGKVIASLSGDGRLRGYEKKRGAEEAWTVKIDNELKRGWTLVDKLGALVVTDTGRVPARRPEQGQPSDHGLDRSGRGRCRGGPLRSDRAVFVFVRGERDSIDVVKLDVTTFEREWRFTLKGGLKGRPELIGSRLVVFGAGKEGVRPAMTFTMASTHARTAPGRSPGAHKPLQLAAGDVRYSLYPLGVWQRPTPEAR